MALITHNWKRFSLRRLVYLPHLFSREEKRSLLLFGAVAFLSIIGLLSRIYVSVTNQIPAVGGSYTEGLTGEPRTINPLYSSRDDDRDIERLVFSSLLRYDEKGHIQNDLAEHYEISPDGKTYSIALRKNALWHDGKQVSTDDIAFTIKTIQNPQYKSPLWINWQGVVVEKIDEHTIRFVLRNAYAPFIENLTVGILPKHLWENIKPEQAILHDLNVKPIGSGPYRFSSFQKDNNGIILSYTLTQNPHYYREGPYIKTIKLLFFKNGEEVFNAWQRGLIDGFGPVLANHFFDIQKKRGTVYPLYMPRVFGVFFNQTHASALADKNVRKAIGYAIERNTLAAAAPSGGFISENSPLPWLGNENPNSTDSSSPHQTTSNSSTSDPEKARQILEKAGWNGTNDQGIRIKKNAVKKNTSKKSASSGSQGEQSLSFTLVTADWPDLVSVAERMKSQLKEVGIGITVEKMPFDELESNVIRPRNFDILLFGEVYGFEPDPFAFWHSSQIKDPGLNISLYASKKADGVLETARKTSDPDLRRTNYQQLSQILKEDQPAIFLFSQLYYYLLPTNLQGVKLGKISLPADRFNTIPLWFRSTRRVFK